MPLTILIADDEAVLRKVLVRNFEAEGYRVLEAADGEEALQLAHSHAVALIVLDIMMPKINGYHVCSSLRKEGNRVPIIMLTARGDTNDRIDGFELGADDYVVKPFSIKELLQRVAAVLRRSQPALEQQVTRGAWTFDFARWTAAHAGVPVEFTRKELEMLQLLIARDGRPVTRDEFLDQLWPPETYPTNRTIDTHILALRKKLAQGTGLSIATEHRHGYKLVAGP